MINPLEGHVALDRNAGPGYNTLFLRLIPGDLNSACPHKQFYTLPGARFSKVRTNDFCSTNSLSVC